MGFWFFVSLLVRFPHYTFCLSICPALTTIECEFGIWKVFPFLLFFFGFFIWIFLEWNMMENTYYISDSRIPGTIGYPVCCAWSFLIRIKSHLSQSEHRVHSILKWIELDGIFVIIFFRNKNNKTKVKSITEQWPSALHWSHFNVNEFRTECSCDFEPKFQRIVWTFANVKISVHVSFCCNPKCSMYYAELVTFHFPTKEMLISLISLISPVLTMMICF